MRFLTAEGRVARAAERSNERLLRPPLPFCANVELTSVCNQKCVMCPLTARNTLSSRDTGHMQPAVWAKVLPALRQIGQVQWIGYGETRLHPQAIQHIAEADGHGVWSSLTTNGTTLTEETCAALGRLRHLVHVSVSIDSLNPEVYRSIRKTPLAKALRGLETLVRHVDRRKVTVGSVAMRDNMEHLDGLPAYIASLGLSKYQINVLHENKGKHAAGELGPDARGALDRLTAACAASGVQLVVDVPARLSLNVGDTPGYRAAYTGEPQDALTRQCLLPWEFPFIDKDGNVFLCSNATGRASEVLGSLRDHSFPDIWHNDRFRDVRRRFLSSEPLPPSCKSCTIQALGVHPLHGHRAEILSAPVIRTPDAEQEAALVVRNTGGTAWAAGEVAVGTVRPRDRVSLLHTPHWLSVNRVAANPHPVEPGGTGRFALSVSGAAWAGGEAGGRARAEAFQLVLDGRHWIAGSEFAIMKDTPRSPVARLANRLWEGRL